MGLGEERGYWLYEKTSSEEGGKNPSAVARRMIDSELHRHGQRVPATPEAISACRAYTDERLLLLRQIEAFFEAASKATRCAEPRRGPGHSERAKICRTDANDPRWRPMPMSEQEIDRDERILRLAARLRRGHFSLFLKKKGVRWPSNPAPDNQPTRSRGLPRRARSHLS
jgi:hypothetical protein